MDGTDDLYEPPSTTPTRLMPVDTDVEIKTRPITARRRGGAKLATHRSGRAEKNVKPSPFVPPLTLSHVSSRVIHIKFLAPPKMVADYVRITGTEIVVLPTAQNHSHPELALQRQLAVYRLFNVHNKTWEPNLVIDVGAAMDTHIGRHHVHGLCPIVSPSDTYRQSKWTTVNPAYWCKHTMQQFTSGECNHVPERERKLVAGISIHSVYYLPAVDIARFISTCEQATMRPFVLYAIFHRFTGTEGRFGEMAWERQGGEVVCKMGNDIYSHDAMDFLNAANNCIPTQWGTLGWHEEFRIRDTYCYAFYVSSVTVEHKELTMDAALGDNTAWYSVNAGKLFAEAGKYMTETMAMNVPMPRTIYSVGQYLDITVSDTSRFTLPKTLFQECVVAIAGRARTPDTWVTHVSTVRNLFNNYRLSAHAKEQGLMPVAVLSFVKNMERDVSWMQYMVRNFTSSFDAWNAAIKFRAPRTVTLFGVGVAAVAIAIVLYKAKKRLLPGLIAPIIYQGTTLTALHHMVDLLTELDGQGNHVQNWELSVSSTAMLPAIRKERDEDRARDGPPPPPIDPVLAEIRKLTPMQVIEFATTLKAACAAQDRMRANGCAFPYLEFDAGWYENTRAIWERHVNRHVTRETSVSWHDWITPIVTRLKQFVMSPVLLYTDVTSGFCTWFLRNRRIWYHTMAEEVAKWFVPGVDHALVVYETYRAIKLFGISDGISARIIPNIIHYLWRVHPALGVATHLSWNVNVFWGGCNDMSALSPWYVVVAMVIGYVIYRIRHSSVRQRFLDNYAEMRGTILPTGIHNTSEIALPTIQLPNTQLPPALAKLRVNVLKEKTTSAPATNLVFGIAERPPIIPASTTSNEVLGVCRAVQDTKSDDPPPFNEKLFSANTGLFSPFLTVGMYAPPFVPDHDALYNEWLARYPVNKRQRIEDAKVKTEGTGILDNNLDCFIKREKYFKTDADGTHPILPRMISATSLSMNAFYGPWAWGLGVHLSKFWNWGGHIHVNLDGDMNALDVMVNDFVSRHGMYSSRPKYDGWKYDREYDPNLSIGDNIERFVRFYEADFSKFDGSYTEAAIALEGAIYAKYGMSPEKVLKLFELRAHRHSSTAHGVSWDLPFKRASGEVFTAIGNSLINLYLFLLAIHPYMDLVEDLFVAVCGDDHANGIKWSMERADRQHWDISLTDHMAQFRQDWIRIAASYGFKIVIQSHTDICRLSYLSCCWVPIPKTKVETPDGPRTISLKLGVMPGRWLARIGWVANESAQQWRANALLAGTFQSMEFLTSHVPYARHMVSLLRPHLGEKVIAQEGMDWRVNANRRVTTVVEPDSFTLCDAAFLKRRYGLDESDAREFYMLLTSITQLPVFVSHPVLKDMVDYDMEL